jgi:hypothetical protein
MITWEYVIADDLTIQRLSELGDEGWELVCVQPYSHDGFESGIPVHDSGDTFYLKRSVQRFYPPRRSLTETTG